MESTNRKEANMNTTETNTVNVELTMTEAVMLGSYLQKVRAAASRRAERSDTPNAISTAKAERDYVNGLVVKVREAVDATIDEAHDANDHEATAAERFTKAHMNTIGKAVKSADPDTVRRMRSDGYKTGNVAVAEYVLSCDPDQFDRLVEDLVEDGDLPATVIA